MTIEMTDTEYQRKLENAGYEGCDVHDLLAERRRERLLEELQEMGYTEDDLEASNPYNQWSSQ